MKNPTGSTEWERRRRTVGVLHGVWLSVQLHSSVVDRSSVPLEALGLIVSLPPEPSSHAE